MVKRNPHLEKLNSGYLFPEIIRRKQLFLERHPKTSLISLGIGDTTEPLPLCVSQALADSAKRLGTEEGYTGYGPEEGLLELRKRISTVFYAKRFDQEEIFISDGTNCDIGRLQTLFGPLTTLAVQDPTYPVYVDTAVITGQTGHFDPSSRRYKGIVYMPCLPSNDFFPDLDKLPRADLIYFCSPNNPTGHAASKQQLTALVEYAKANHSLIIFDTAYACFIQDPSIPRSIYEIEGADTVAIELGSFSKMAGFTGVRLGWTVVPKAICYEGGKSINGDWNRVHTTFFNGASNLAQQGGIAALSVAGQSSLQQLVQFYMENAALLRKSVKTIGLETYGGDNAPYIWVRYPHLSSWEAFDKLLNTHHLLSAPGSGFGPGGEGFIRLSAFAKREAIIEACRRLADKNLIC